MSDLIIRETVEDIVNQRNKTLIAYDVAYEKLTDAADALMEANILNRKNRRNNTSYNDFSSKEKYILDNVKLPTKEDFDKKCKRIVDSNIWSFIVEHTGLENLMDKKSKDELRNQLRETPPEITVDTIYATLETFQLQSGEIFKRGIAEVFSSLDRRFRSHCGFKIGSRIILNNAFTEYGSWNYHRLNQRDALIDIERTFRILDGKKETNYSDIITKIDDSRQKLFGTQQSYVETEYFRLRGFHNGNLHVWIRREDLLNKVNKLLAEYYGEVIPQERGQTEEEILKSASRNPLSKNYSFYPTPESVANRIINDELNFYRIENTVDILEPSAGTGNLAKLCVNEKSRVDCVEIQESFVNDLRNSGLYNNVICSDFLELKPTKLYDYIVMNPPFDVHADILHVNHALTFLKDGGKLISIMSASTEFKEDKISVAFRNKIKSMKGKFRDLPKGSFSSVGTNVNTILLTVRK